MIFAVSWPITLWMLTNKYHLCTHIRKRHLPRLQKIFDRECAKLRKRFAKQRLELSDEDEQRCVEDDSVKEKQNDEHIANERRDENIIEDISQTIEESLDKNDHCCCKYYMYLYEHFRKYVEMCNIHQ